ncbi:hypothetical protein ITP53_43770 [Nonomuraea sp. K274]|uniref:Uncharacterized protein n=1 Tax=Nonomuraea cypriaca TaxID=1187855 RepID=A0A931F5V7_9ACTN|nr:hypothetical protein [Nonomuraea cypriaca]MBF8192486.1 hypothetical protein [Nonomuraea cypriaca]
MAGAVAGLYDWRALVQARIVRFAPRVDPVTWERIGAEVARIVAAPEPCTPAMARLFLGTLTALARFAEARGYPARGTVWLSEELICAFTEQGCAHLSASTRASYASRLRRLALAAGVNGRAVPLSATDTARPYEAAEVGRLWAAAAGQRTPELRADARLLIGLGAGCGLSAAEIGWVRAHDVRACPAAVVVAVRGVRARLVVARRPFEQPLAEAAASRMGQVVYLLAPHRFKARERAASATLAKIRLPEQAPALATRRLRATWLAALLEAGVSLPVIAAVAGIDNLAVLTAMLRHVGRR